MDGILIQAFALRTKQRHRFQYKIQGCTGYVQEDGPVSLFHFSYPRMNKAALSMLTDARSFHLEGCEEHNEFPTVFEPQPKFSLLVLKTSYINNIEDKTVNQLSHIVYTKTPSLQPHVSESFYFNPSSPYQHLFKPCTRLTFYSPSSSVLLWEFWSHAPECLHLFRR